MSPRHDPLRIALVGDRAEEIPAHEAIALALSAAARQIGTTVDAEWLPTAVIHEGRNLERYAGIWAVPGSPYRSEAGALSAIRFARLAPRPFLGTCGGLQHAVLEYARGPLGLAAAEHAESAPDTACAVIDRLGAPRQQERRLVCFVPGTLVAAAYGRTTAREVYHCRYGISPAFEATLLAAELRPSGYDSDGTVCAVELVGHPFFLATLFQPELSALNGERVPLAEAFVRACAGRNLTSSPTNTIVEKAMTSPGGAAEGRCQQAEKET